MGRVIINAPGICEVARVASLKEIKYGVYKRIKINRLYRSDGIILEKYIGYRELQIPDWNQAKWKTEDRSFSFGWKEVGKAKEPPNKWIEKYKDNWKITRRSDVFMAKYISEKEIKRLKNGL